MTRENHKHLDNCWGRSCEVVYKHLSTSLELETFHCRTMSMDISCQFHVDPLVQWLRECRSDNMVMYPVGTYIDLNTYTQNIANCKAKFCCGFSLINQHFLHYYNWWLGWFCDKKEILQMKNLLQFSQMSFLANQAQICITAIQLKLLSL